MISVIVPVYKVEKYIYRCIDSILNQSFTDFELILVEDGSPDNCAAICDEYARNDKRIVVIHQKNGGVSSARNAGINWAFKNSNSEWIAFIDSDDWVHPYYLEALYKAVSENDMLISSLFITSVNNTKESNQYSKCEFSFSIESTEDVYTCFGHGLDCYAQGRLYKKELWRDVRFPIGKIFEDVATIFKVLLKSKYIVLVHDKLYYYYFNNDGIVGTTLKKWAPNCLDELQAYEIQLKDKRIKRNNKIYIPLKQQYIDKIYRQYNQIQRDATQQNNKRLLQYYNRKFRFALIKYARGTKYDFKKREYHYLYEKLFPKFMWIYYLVLARLR